MFPSLVVVSDGKFPSDVLAYIFCHFAEHFQIFLGFLTTDLSLPVSRLSCRAPPTALITADRRRKGPIILPGVRLSCGLPLIIAYRRRREKSSSRLLDEVEEFFTVLPVFRNLTYLQLTAVPMCFDFKALLNILQKSPCLETLIFHEGVEVSSFCVKDDDGILDPVPSCFLSHLKRIEVYNFDGNEEQLYVIKILLKNATVLEKMVITSWVHRSGSGMRKKVRKQLLSLPRGSASCSVVLCEEIFPV
ncbi:hypothetical protein L1049_009781 [Liquidambar formosana]|uniref:FBD domain-containing protein n=1 Tax=Liquidambar formosana TaxID=63359 RepID=A0AAP0N7W2_LIQFO